VLAGLPRSLFELDMEPFTYKPASDHGLTESQRVQSVHREPGLVGVLGRRLACAAINVYFALYHRLRISGRGNIPTELPFVMVANHESHLDALILAAAVPRALRHRVYPVAAADAFFTNYRSAALTTLFVNALPIHRKKVPARALADLRHKLLDEPCGMILFPEGARTRDGALMRFKPGIGMLVAGTRVKVVPCWIEGAFEALGADAKVPKPKRLTLNIGPALVFEGVPDEREGWERVAWEIRMAVEGLGVSPQS